MNVLSSCDSTQRIAYVYTATDLQTYPNHPLLLDKLDRRNIGSCDRVILSAPLSKWAGLPSPGETGEGDRTKNAARDQGSNNAEKP